MNDLLKKMQYKGQQNVWVENSPEIFSECLKILSSVENIFNVSDNLENVEFAVLFIMAQSQIDEFAKKVSRIKTNDPAIWFCYPKKSSKKYSCEINRDHGWEILSDIGYKPVRQIAIDEDWSGLRFRKETLINRA